MRWLVLNGSPRGKRSNTDLLLRPLLAGIAAGGGAVEETLHLVRPGDLARAVEAFPRADAVLLAFPLYCDALPAPALAFVQRLAPLVGRSGNPALCFLVQSGFPEALHMRPVERWLEKLARRLGAPYLGAILKPGAEGMRDRPESWERKGLERLAAIGRTLGAEGRLDPALVAALARPERLGSGLLGPLRVRLIAWMASAWWNGQLKRNGVPDVSARPYAQDA